MLRGSSRQAMTVILSGHSCISGHSRTRNRTLQLGIPAQPGPVFGPNAPGIFCRHDRRAGAERDPGAGRRRVRHSLHQRDPLLRGELWLCEGPAQPVIGGHLSESWGRKPVLVLGWLVAVPIPLIIIWAPNWWWIVFANLLMGVNQGLAWSMTVTSKMDIVGSKWRGLATGINEFAGYSGVATAALVTGFLAAAYGLRPAPFYFGLAVILSALGIARLLLSRETVQFARREADLHDSGERRSARQLSPTARRRQGANLCGHLQAHDMGRPRDVRRQPGRSVTQVYRRPRLGLLPAVLQIARHWP